MPRKKPATPGPMDSVEVVPLDDLVLDTRNARKGDIPAQVESLREFGQHRPVVVQRGTNKVIAGNHMVQAMRVLGWTEAGVHYVDDDDDTATRRSIADNAVGDRAKWDTDILKDLLGEVGTDIAGLDQKVVDKLLADTADASVTAEPVYPIVPNAGEHYTYVLVIAQNIVDEAFLMSAFQIRPEKSYKSQNVKPSKVISTARFRELVPSIAAAVAAADQGQVADDE